MRNVRSVVVVDEEGEEYTSNPPLEALGSLVAIAFSLVFMPMWGLVGFAERVFDGIQLIRADIREGQMLAVAEVDTDVEA